MPPAFPSSVGSLSHRHVERALHRSANVQRGSHAKQFARAGVTTAQVALQSAIGQVRLGYPPAIIFKNERTKYLSAMRKADAGDLGPMGELIARSVTKNLYRFVIPAVAGPARLVPLASPADKKSGLTANALRVAAIRGRLRAQKSGQGTWLSSKKWVHEYQESKYSRG